MDSKSFTIEYNGILDTLMTTCHVCEAFGDEDLQKGLKPPLMKEFVALWDTGATASVISENVARLLDLEPTGREIMYHANGSSPVNAHSVNILLPNNVGFSYLKVTECILNGIDILIGMDIISKGDFAITSFCGNTKFSFNMPSTHNIDFRQATPTSSPPAKGIHPHQ